MFLSQDITTYNLIYFTLIYFTLKTKNPLCANTTGKIQRRKDFFLMQINNNMYSYDCQVSKILRKTAIKKRQNESIIQWLNSEKQERTAVQVQNCATSLGITDIDGIARVVRADFCRERICAVCAWRRQVRFVAQTTPILDYMSEHGYQFIFATVTVKNVSYNELDKTLSLILKGFANLRHRAEIKRAWRGIIRSVELTYNENNNTFHPHIHMLIAVDKSYYENSYISQARLSELWRDCINADYVPVVDIRRVNDTERAAVESLKYSLKPTVNPTALSAFYYILKGRRLISFTGIFKTLRTEFKLSDFENILTDDLPQGYKVRYSLYKLDCSGGLYKYYKDKELSI